MRRAEVSRQPVYAVALLAIVVHFDNAAYARLPCPELVRQLAEPRVMERLDRESLRRPDDPQKLLSDTEPTSAPKRSHKIENAVVRDPEDPPRRHSRNFSLGTTRSKPSIRRRALDMVIAIGLPIPGTTAGIGGTPLLSAGISETVIVTTEEEVSMDYGCPGPSNELVMEEDKDTGMMFSVCAGTVTCFFRGRSSIAKLSSEGFSILGDTWEKGEKGTTEAVATKRVEIDINDIGVSREAMLSKCREEATGGVQFVRNQLAAAESTIKAVANGFTGRVLCVKDGHCDRPTYISHGLGWDDDRRIGRCATFGSDPTKAKLACMNLWKPGERCYNANAQRSLPPMQWANDWNTDPIDIHRHTACDWGHSCQYETWEWVWKDGYPGVENIYRCKPE